MLALLLVQITLSLPEAIAMTHVPVLPTLFPAACFRAAVLLYCKAEVILRCGRVAPKGNVLQHGASTHKERNLSFLGKIDPYKAVHTLWCITLSSKDKAEARENG